jgi:hypothetical protein
MGRKTNIEIFYKTQGSLTLGRNSMERNELMAARGASCYIRHMIKDDRVEGYLQSASIDRVADYLQRGRKHSGLSVEQLTADWMVAFAEIAVDPTNADLTATHNDFDAEFAVRKINPPYDAASDIMDVYCKNVDALIEDVERNDPAHFYEMRESMIDDLDTFEEESKKPN